jgi:hypothetical protein
MARAGWTTPTGSAGWWSATSGNGRRAGPHRCQEAGSHPRRWWPPRPRPRRHHPNRRGIGHDYIHSAVDDRSRVAFSQILPDESAATAGLFLIEAASFFADHGVRIQRVLPTTARPMPPVDPVRRVPVVVEHLMLDDPRRLRGWLPQTVPQLWGLAPLSAPRRRPGPAASVVQCSAGSTGMANSLGSVMAPTRDAPPWWRPRALVAGRRVDRRLCEPGGVAPGAGRLRMPRRDVPARAVGIAWWSRGELVSI